MATHSSIRTWEIPWAEEPGRLQSIGSHKSCVTLWTVAIGSHNLLHWSNLTCEIVGDNGSDKGSRDTLLRFKSWLCHFPDTWPFTSLCLSFSVCCVYAQSFSHVWFFLTPWTVARHTPLSIGLPFPRDLPHPGIKPTFLASPALTGGFFTTAPPGKSLSVY